MTITSSHLPLIKIENLNKSFKENQILKNVNFDINTGEILSLIGLSGCGKSTLLNILCGFLKQDSGNIIYEFSSSKKLFFTKLRESEKIRRLFGFSSQEPSFYKELTVYENLKYFGTMLYVPKHELEEKIIFILKKLNLTDCKDHLSSSLSEGMKKRLDFACSIIHTPQILILDEPTSNLDFKLRRELLKYIQKINKLGMTIIFVSHYIEEITEISDRVAVLSKSKIKVYENTKTFQKEIMEKF